jgi:hypothetical protein
MFSLACWWHYPSLYRGRRDVYHVAGADPAFYCELHGSCGPDVFFVDNLWLQMHRFISIRSTYILNTGEINDDMHRLSVYIMR